MELHESSKTLLDRLHKHWEEPVNLKRTDRIERMRLLRPLVYLWVFPGTAVGLMATALALATGGRMQVVDGVLEVHGGLVTLILKRGNRWVAGPIAAMTLGHVVIGCDEATLRMTRRHERVHVRQYERWGPFFIPVYLGCSAWLGMRGYNSYLDNPFEIEAYSIDDSKDT